MTNMKRSETVEGTRPYDMTERARAAAATGKRILDAARNRFSTMTFDQVTLNDVADDAGVTVQTVIRRFGSKEDLFTYLAERESARILAEREPGGSTDGSLEAALQTLVDHYERDGETVLNLLAQESRFPMIAEVVASGRDFHEKWVEEHCRSVLEGAKGKELGRRLQAAVAATDIYTWKLLRLDRGLSRDEVIKTMRILLEGLEKTGNR